MAEQPSTQTAGRISGRTVAAIFIGVLVLWMLTPLGMSILVAGGLPERGQAGDMFGSVNALFSGLAFAGVIVAILLQREELALQRRELEYTRQELTRSANAQEQAQQALNKTIYAQTFKVALDILEDPKVISARGYVVQHTYYDESTRSFPTEHDRMQAELVSRSFESVGTLIRKNLLPPEYITDTWSIPIIRCWDRLEKFNLNLRSDRNDPYLAKDFEELAKHARAFLAMSAEARPR